MAALRRDGNVLGALSLAVADQMSDAVAAAAGQSVTAAAALSALEHFADGCSVDRLRRILGLTSSGTVRLVDRLVSVGDVRRREGPDGRTTSIELTAAGRRAARRVTAARGAVLEEALSGLSPAERADLDRLAARVLGGVVRAKLARDAGGESTRWTCRLCDLHACGRAEGRCPAATAAASASASASASRG
jgi:DNA-binding MarR family transcriptional regulator